MGKELEIEVTVEYERRRCRATVVKTPFFDPARKKAVGRPAAAVPEVA
jgi:glycine cleavage system aminomethyltransferase T